MHMLKKIKFPEECGGFFPRSKILIEEILYFVPVTIVLYSDTVFHTEIINLFKMILLI